MPTVKTASKPETLMEEMRQAGAHYGYAKSRRHPSTGKFVYSVKNGLEIFDLEKTSVLFEKALEFVRGLGSEKKKILFVGTKNEARRAIKSGAESIEAPVVVRRWIGGTLTNWSQTKKRIEKLKEMKEKMDSGEYEEKYTKKERLLLSREVESLESNFGGIVGMEGMPDAMFVVDSSHEDIAVREARAVGIPIIALSNNDCDISEIEYPIPANDSSVKSIDYFVSKTVKAHIEGKTSK